MAIPHLSVLSDDEIQAIHTNSLSVLERTGVSVDSQRALNLLEEAGAEIHYDAKTAKIPPYLVEETIKKAPKNFTLCSRDPKKDIFIGKDSKRVVPYFSTAGFAPYFYDLQTGERRTVTERDLSDATKVVDALDNINFLPLLATPHEIPHGVSDRYMWLISFKNSAKHINGDVWDANAVSDLVKMASLIVGGKDELTERPIISLTYSVDSPLVHSKRPIEVLLEASRYGIPVFVSSGAIAGGTSPVTLAGTLVLTNAELLSGLVMTQIVNPGTPVIFGSYARAIDARTAHISVGGPEFGLMHACLAEMARYYELPSAQGGFTCDSKIPDAQAGYEAIMTALMATLSRADIVWGMFLDSNATISCEYFVLCDEIAGIISRIAKGIQVDDDTLAAKVIDRVGPGGSFLTQGHTAKYLRKELFTPSISSRGTWGFWQRSGGKDIWEKAKEKARKILSTHEPEPLPTDVERDLDKIVEEARKSVGV